MSDDEGRFSFIDDEILRQNLNQVFSDIVDFTSIMDGFNEESIQINFRRAVILYTAAIIEALLHYIVEKKVDPLEFEEDEWRFDGDVHVFHRYQDEDGRDIQVVCGRRFKKKIPITRGTQFKTMIKVSNEHSLITDSLAQEIDKIRKLRNRIHLASLDDIEKKYTKPILNNVFEIARKVVKVAQKL